MQTTLPVSAIVERLARKELELKKVGAYAEAAGIRDAVVIVYRLADEEPQVPPIEPSEP